MDSRFESLSVNENDFNDAEAIAEAASRATMRCGVRCLDFVHASARA
jgi:hypothetical protein